jgi:fructose-specific phosphotransferase system IIA component
MIANLLSKELYIPQLNATEKYSIIDEMIEKLDTAGRLSDKAALTQAVLAREAEFSTAIGMGIAIPHGKSKGVTTPSLVFARSAQGADFESMDDEPSFLFFLIAVPADGGEEHLKVLSTLSRKLMHTQVRQDLMNATHYDDIIAILEG